jgi:DNA-binding transcriptional MerR regulator
MEDKKKMKTTNKKLVGGLLINILIGTIGVAYATAQTDTINDDTIPQIPFGMAYRMNEFGPLAFDMTDEQLTELKELITTLREQNATHEEIQIAIQEKLDEYGVLDTQLDNKIAQTEQRLTVLNRQKELRNEGYSWDEIGNIIEDEFSLENTTAVGWNMMDGQRFEHEPYKDLQDIISGEESDQ